MKKVIKPLETMMGDISCPANVSRLDLHGRMCGLYQDDCKYPHREECPRYRTEVIPRRNSSTTS